MDAASTGAQQDVSRSEFQELTAEVRALAGRLKALEQARGIEAAPTAPALPQLHVSSELAPAIGRALLAIAGAYLLRALTELSILPAAAGAVAGTVYAAAWLWLATRAQTKIPARLYASAAMLILGPLLFEAIDRMHAIPPWTAAAVLAAFAIATARRDWVAPVTSVAAALIAFSLLVVLHAMMPFTLAILAIAAAAEWAEVEWRWAVAWLADFAVVVFWVVVARGVPAHYPPASVGQAVVAQTLLAAIYGAVLIFRRREITAFEILQAACAVAIGAGGAFMLTHSTAVGWATVAASMICYAELWRRDQTRNARVFAAWAIALALAGSYVAMPRPALALIWSALSVAIAFSHLAAFHAWLYLWSAAIVSGAAMTAKLRVWDEADAPVTAAMLAILLAAAIGYFVLLRGGQIVPALATSICGCAMIAALMERFAPGALSLAVLAIAAGWSGARFRRRELVWLTYLLMTVAGAKIVLHDFALGTMTLVVTLLGYGVAWIVLPRILRAPQASADL